METNALELKNYIEELYWGCGKRVLLLGHSKGGVDAAAAVSKYWSDLKEKVAGLVVIQSPYGGSPIASDILREGQIADAETRRIMELIITKIVKVSSHIFQANGGHVMYFFLSMPAFFLPCNITLVLLCFYLKSKIQSDFASASSNGVAGFCTWVLDCGIEDEL